LSRDDGQKRMAPWFSILYMVVMGGLIVVGVQYDGWWLMPLMVILATAMACMLARGILRLGCGRWVILFPVGMVGFARLMWDQPLCLIPWMAFFALLNQTGLMLLILLALRLHSHTTANAAQSLLERYDWVMTIGFPEGRERAIGLASVSRCEAYPTVPYDQDLSGCGLVILDITRIRAPQVAAIVRQLRAQSYAGLVVAVCPTHGRRVKTLAMTGIDVFCYEGRLSELARLIVRAGQ